MPGPQVKHAVLDADLGLFADIHSTPETNELAVGHGHLQHTQLPY
jgi:hypothetical protein